MQGRHLVAAARVQRLAVPGQRGPRAVGLRPDRGFDPAVDREHRDGPAARPDGEPALPDGMKLGDPVIIVHDDFGSGNVIGTLAASGIDEIAVRREGERAGEVIVHFPREDYSVIAIG